MEVYLNRIDGWDDAILTMFYSKRTITREFEQEVRNTVYESTISSPAYSTAGRLCKTECWEKTEGWLKTLFKWAPHHITMGRFLDFSFTVYGMHRAGQDDLLAYAVKAYTTLKISRVNHRSIVRYYFFDLSSRRFSRSAFLAARSAIFSSD